MPFGQLWTIISNFEIFLIWQRYKGILTAVFSGGKLDRYVSKIKDGRNVSISKQRAGEIKEKASEQIKKTERLLVEIDKRIADLRLTYKNF